MVELRAVQAEFPLYGTLELDGGQTYSHAMLLAADVDAEIGRAQDILAARHGTAPKWFRAPYGVRWFGLREAQRRHGLTGVMWSTIGCDWKAPGERVAARLVRKSR